MPAPSSARRGPHLVGVIDTEIASPLDPLDPHRRLPCSIWYPAAADQTEGEGAAHPLELRHRANQGLAPFEGRCPLIVFSHGNSGYRQQSTFLTTHLASWGFVVAAPDHTGNTFGEMFALKTEEERRAVHLRARAQRPEDVRSTIHALADTTHEESRRPPIEPIAIGVIGHSFGGWTALKLPALDRRVRALCCLAPASEPFVGRKAFAPGELPLPNHVQSLVIAARDDVLVDLEDSIHPLFGRLGAAAELEILPDADHFHFCDGIELLHRMHENQPRPDQPRPTRPLSQLMAEEETHDWLNGRVTRFFLDALDGATP